MAERQTNSQNRGGASDRVQDTVDAWGRRAGRLVASVAARAREEAEDIWAEAQSVRRGEND